MLNALMKPKNTSKPDPAVVNRLYLATTSLARAPVFYTRFGVPDTTDGRFDLLCLMLSLVLFRVQAASGDVAQALFDLAFNDIELGLREVGIGDLGVPKHMKKMMQAFYGRAAGYYDALEQHDQASLEAILSRNLYGEAAAKAPVAAMAEWVMIAWGYLRTVDAAAFMAEPDSLIHLIPPEQEGVSS